MSQRSTDTGAPTMRAISQDVYGGPEVLREVRIPRPVPGISEILVSVRAAGINPTDWRHRAHGLFLNRLPLVLGWDVSGVVAAVGVGVTVFEPATRSSACSPIPTGSGRTPNT
ncbi:alcohol dehydrogenase catalytic domain-containing protein [Pengzhenrongella sp.]|jgi:NADPH:quinone reductase-like Zn-dependent oxidoreductase|uniref:alcohol dehydrogenase catalytic domain-containing protein n=1 Tax=Pengzhenrongella sp. TaxID=2888820 RepID=UPI002F933258